MTLPPERDVAVADGTRERLRFAEFTFDAVSGELTRDGEPVPLAPQPARVLAMLLRRAGELVSREELYDELWGDDVHVDYRQGLNYCIRQVRIALGEDAQRPRFLETLSRRGYRFRARLMSVVEADADRLAPAATPAPGVAARHRPLASGWRAAAIPAAAALLLVLLGLAVALSGHGVGSPLKEEATEIPATPTPGSGVALESYLQARYLAGKQQPELRRAIEQYRIALRADAGFAAAHAGLAEAYQKLTGGGALPPEDGYSRSVIAASRAIELGHETADVYLTRGIARLYRDLDWDVAAVDFDRARRLEPGNARAWFWHARALSATGAHDAARDAAERSLLLDPESRQIVVDLGWFHVLAGRYREAITQCRRALALEPGSVPALQCLIAAHLRLGDRSSAADAATQLLDVFADLTGRDAPPLSAGTLERGPDWARAGEWLAELCPYNSFATSRAVMYTLAGNIDAAIEQLVFAVDKRQGWAPFIALDPTFAELHADPRFRALIGSTG